MGGATRALGPCGQDHYETYKMIARNNAPSFTRLKPDSGRGDSTFPSSEIGQWGKREMGQNGERFDMGNWKRMLKWQKWEIKGCGLEENRTVDETLCPPR